MLLFCKLAQTVYGSLMYGKASNVKLTLARMVNLSDTTYLATTILLYLIKRNEEITP